ncbi:syndecan-1-like [Megalops cyprinoides]|uniref:syndecan-1-like n=1 Tax=Megalops cyprinoides TaxID=118141 RepID=UPI001864FF24|nr:syndecan-1-like [Megalops cyprinoides]
MILEALNGSGDDLDNSGSGDWEPPGVHPPTEGETGTTSAPPSGPHPEDLQHRAVSASPAETMPITTPPHAKATPKTPPTALTAGNVEHEVVGEPMITPPEDEGTAPPTVHSHTTPRLEEEGTARSHTTPRLEEEGTARSHTTPCSEEADCLDSSGDDAESGDGAVGMSTSSLLTTERRTESIFTEEEKLIPHGRAHNTDSETADDSDLTFDPKTKEEEAETTDSPVGSLAKSQGLLEKKEVLAGVLTGGVVGLILAVALLSLMGYRMKKKDEGSYSLDVQQSGYQRPQRQEEFLA